MKVSCPSGNCPYHPHTQLPSGSKPTSSRSPHHTGSRKDSPPSTVWPHQFHCSHNLNFPRSARVSWRHLHIITSWPSSPSSLHANFVAIRENAFDLSAKSNQGFSGGSHTSYLPRHHFLSCTELQTWHIGPSLVRTDLGLISLSSCYRRHISLCSTTSRHLTVPIH